MHAIRARRPMTACYALRCGLLLAWLAVPAIALADDFRVHNKIFLAGGKEPVAETITVFRAGRVYDFQPKTLETTIFDPSQDLFVLLDAGRRTKCEVPTARIADYVARLKIEARMHGEPLLAFLADPRFDESTDADSGALNLSSDWLSYRVETEKAATSQSALQYGEFADWSAQLNCLANPSSLPPFARLALNDALRRRQALPLRLEFSLSKRAGGRPALTRRSQHTVQWGLSQEDQRRINEAADQLATFTTVGLDQYLRRPPKTP